MLPKSCEKCSFSEEPEVLCIKCGWNSEVGEFQDTPWMNHAQPADRRLFLQIHILSNLNEIAFRILISKLVEVQLFGLPPEMPNRERWLFYASDNGYDDETAKAFAELAGRELELSNIVTENPTTFRDFMQGDYFFELVKQQKVSHGTIQRFISRHRRIDEKDASKFWDRQYMVFLKQGFRAYFELLMEELSEIASQAWADLTPEEIAAIYDFWSGPSGYDGYRARSWKNRWAP